MHNGIFDERLEELIFSEEQYRRVQENGSMVRLLVIRWLDSIQERVKTIVRIIGREYDEYMGQIWGGGSSKIGVGEVLILLLNFFTPFLRNIYECFVIPISDPVQSHYRVSIGT